MRPWLLSARRNEVRTGSGGTLCLAHRARRLLDVLQQGPFRPLEKLIVRAEFHVTLLTDAKHLVHG